MNKEALQGQRQYFDMVHGVTLQAIGTFSDADLDYRPTPEMRTVRELIHHIYAQEKQLAEEISQGRFGPHGETVADRVSAEIAGLKTVADAQQFADKWHKA